MIELWNFSDCSKVVRLRQRLLAESEAKGRTVLRYIRADKSAKSKDGKLTLLLLPQAEQPLMKIIGAEDKLTELETDMGDFVTLLKNYPNILMLVESLNRERTRSHMLRGKLDFFMRVP